MRVLVLLCICVVALAGPNCQSLITKDCGTATGDACKKCVQSHGLHEHGCTNAQIALFCGGPSPCAKELDKDCPAKERAHKRACMECAQAHEADLQKANCTKTEVQEICAGGPSPAPGPAPPSPSPGPAGDVLTKFLLDNSNASAVGGRCLDGSPSGYYYAGAKTNATNKWVIHLKGGGGCASEVSCKKWLAEKGSSKRWPATINGENPLIDGDPAQNPDFYNWNRVQVNYCTGDGHAGQRTGPSAATWNYWFDGHLNVQRVIADLKAKHGLGSATHVLVSGASAGGIGLFVNIDYIASLLPSDAVIKGAPQAGWFFPEDPVATPKGAGLPLNFSAKEITHSTSLPSDDSIQTLQDRYVNPACLAAQPNASYCVSVHNQYPHIKTPLFVVENQYDTAQIYANYGGAPKHPVGKEVAEKADYVSYVHAHTRMHTRTNVHTLCRYYGATMRSSIEPQIRSHGQTKAKGNDGMFLPSCLSHGLSTETTLAAQVSVSENNAAATGSQQANSTQQVNWVEIVGDWYFERNKFVSHMLIDDCKMTDGQPCNPNCPEA